MRKHAMTARDEMGWSEKCFTLTVKEREPDRKDDPFLGEKLIAEAEGIFLWCLEGRHRLIDNGYEFTISKTMR